MAESEAGPQAVQLELFAAAPAVRPELVPVGPPVVDGEAARILAVALKQPEALLFIMETLNEDSITRGFQKQAGRKDPPERIVKRPEFGSRAAVRRTAERKGTDADNNIKRRRAAMAQVIGSEALRQAGASDDEIDQRMAWGTNAIRQRYGIGGQRAGRRRVLIEILNDEIRQRREQPALYGPDPTFLDRMLQQADAQI